MPHDFNRPFVNVSEMENYVAVENDIAVRYGKVVKAMTLTNREYRHRHARRSSSHKMKEPPSSDVHICAGYLVVRRLGQTDQYETWIPDGAFEEMYVPAHPPRDSTDRH